jgi:magnesium chelatase subunit D
MPTQSRNNPGWLACYPFPALVGQSEMKRALLFCAVDPGIGGVLLRGEKGAAKSTAARALGRLLSDGPNMRPTPFVDLPLGATEDRLLGSFNLESAIKKGRLEYQPGLLSQAHGGILYVDEVNLLPGHLAHLILDAAASGQAVVEREGISRAHAARFCLIASMNPEEGPLGPQLLDRFGLCVEVVSEPEPEKRKRLLLRRLAFEADPEDFCRRWRKLESNLKRSISRARLALDGVAVGDAARELAANLAGQAAALGQRAELAMVRAARAQAALMGSNRVSPAMIRSAADLALNHRRPLKPEEQDIPTARVVETPPPGQSQPPPKVVRLENMQEGGQTGHTKGQQRTLYILPPAEVKPVATRTAAREGTSKHQAGRRRARESAGDRGRYLRFSAQRLGRPLALDATIRAAAPHQKARGGGNGNGLMVRKPDIREKVRSSRKGRLLLFCVDASGSMNAAARMQTTKAAILGLLTEAYVKRDRVGLVAFGGNAASELLPPTSSVEVARRMLADLPTGGKTPLASGMATTALVLERELAKDPKLTPLVVILTDGRPNVPLDSTKARQVRAGNKGGGWGDGWGDGGYADREVLDLARMMARDRRPRYVIVDTDMGHFHEINLCRPLADYLGATCVSLGKLTTERVLDLVRAHW